MCVKATWRHQVASVPVVKTPERLRHKVNFSMALPASPLAANEEGVTTRSAIVIRNVTGHHLLEIEGYSRIKELLPKGKYIDSHPFQIGGCLWHIRYYPNGNSREKSAGFVSIFLFLD